MKRVVFWASALLALSAFGCGKKDPLLVGAVGDLQALERGGQSGFRNGVFLAAEDINDRGGAGGRPIHLKLGNDMGDPDAVARVDEKLVAEGVVAIVGHNTSATAAASIPVVQRHKIVVLSTTATSSELSGKKDFFLRDEVTEKALGEPLADYAVKVLGLKSIGAVLDEKNPRFSRPYFDAFQKRMKALGASAELIYPYDNLDVAEAARQAAAFLGRGGQAVLLVTDGVDTRYLGQSLRKIRYDLPLLGSTWAMPPSWDTQIAPLPEGLVLSCSWDPDSQAPAYLEFKKLYIERFKVPVDYQAVHAYEGVTILAKGLEKAGGKPGNLPQALVEIRQFQGLQDVIQINPYGDCERPVYILKAVGGALRRAGDKPPV